MRRSSAPSQRNKFISPLLAHTANSSSTSFIDKYKFISKSQDENINNSKGVQLSSVNKRGVILKESDNLPESSLVVRKFNVVYGKQTKKKHKTWDGDGIVEISGKNITLKDVDGKIIGQSSSRKMNEELVEGSRIFVGSKEVELLDEIDNRTEVKKRPLQEELSPNVEENELKTKKTKLSDTAQQKLASCIGTSPNILPIKKSQNKFKIPLSGTGVEPLVMPRPSEEHQWQYNVNHLPVVDVEVDRYLTKALRQHQREGVTFLYTRVTGLSSQDYTGAILADEMGLGKTLQCITLIWTLLNQGFYGGKPLLKRALVVVPSSLVKNWYNEFIRWIGSFRLKIFAVDKNNKIQNYSKSPFVPVVIISYEMFVKNYSCIKDIDFDLIICDEGHRLKNSNIQTTALLSQLPCMRRVLLTGTPLQNDLQEFYTLVNFVNPGILGSYSDFRNNFEKVIEASREPKAPEDIVALGEEKSKELVKITSNFILRRTQSVIGKYLPPKYEHVVFCTMSPIQRKLYCKLTDYCIQQCDDLLSAKENFDHLSAINYLKKICNHPSLVGSKFFEQSLLNEVQAITSSNGFITASVKLKLLDSMLKSLEKTKEKIVLVSNFTQTLDILEKFCKMRNLKYSRFDGSTPLTMRNSIVSNFNSEQSDIRILLLSSKAGGVGLNLIGASRLILFDSDWNPATDLQAMARIWRDGQKRNVFIYRLLTTGSVEEKIFQRQLKKAGLSESVVDPLAVSAVKLSKEELKDLFEYKECQNQCVTHDSLDCKCDGSGSVPGIPQESCEHEINSDDEFDWDCFDEILPESVDSDRTNVSNQIPDESYSVPGNSHKNDDENGDDIRDCEIIFSPKVEEVKPKALRMNQLFLWEHHAGPISSEILQDIGFNEDIGDQINFLFRNKTI